VRTHAHDVHAGCWVVWWGMRGCWVVGRRGLPAPCSTAMRTTQSTHTNARTIQSMGYTHTHAHRRMESRRSCFAWLVHTASRKKVSWWDSGGCLGALGGARCIENTLYKVETLCVHPSVHMGYMCVNTAGAGGNLCTCNRPHVAAAYADTAAPATVAVATP
jgi:hypothetical protein